LKVSSLGLSFLLRVSCSVAAASSRPLAASSLAVPIPFGVFPALGSHLTPRKNQLPGLRCLLSVSHALKASIRPTPVGLIRADPAHGVSPSGSSSLAEQYHLFRWCCPLEIVCRVTSTLTELPPSILGYAGTAVRPWSRLRSTRRTLSRAFIPASAGFFGLRVRSSQRSRPSWASPP
jgi:hypothetical protein